MANSCKRSVKKIWTHDYWSFNLDGRSNYDRIKGKDKKKLQRWTRNHLKIEFRQTMRGE